jgi:hypothetical protein
MSDPQPLQPIATVEPKCPALNFFARHSEVASWIAAGTGLVILAAHLFSQLGCLAVALAVLVSALIYGAFKLLGDIARLLVETLIPK